MTEAYQNPAHLPWSLSGGPIEALLIPGFLGTPKEMRPLGEALAAAGIGSRAVLLPGFGSDVARLGAVRADDWLARGASEWRQVREAAEVPVLIGFSMGAAVALQLAAVSPPARLVLLAPHWRFAERLARVLPVVKHVVRQLRPFASADFGNPDVRRTFAGIYPGADVDDPTMQARFRKETTLPTAALDQLRRNGRAAAAAAPQVTCPTLVLQPRGDTTAWPRFTRRLATRIAGPIALHELAGGHQMVWPEHPAWDVTRDLVVRFVAQAGDAAQVGDTAQADDA